MLRISWGVGVGVDGELRVWDAIYYHQKDAGTLLDQTRNKCSPDLDKEGSNLRNVSN